MRDLSRRGSRAVRVGLVGGLAVAAGLGLAMAQFNQSNNPVGNQIEPLDRPRMGDQQEPYVAHEMQARQLKRLREEHQKEVFSDTNRLVQLATELKAEVDKGSKPTPDVLKDVDEIGKLAKRVSERIKTQ
ncbi:MAG: hypothetical protein ABSC65_07240 [Acidobacteriaceae bacterium]